MKATTIDVGGGRVVRVGTYTVDHDDGDGPERRVFLAAGWQSVPLLPFTDQTVDIPATAVLPLMAALESLGEGE